MEVHDKIRVMREINQWSQEEMAEKLAMSANGYAKIERGQTNINIEKLKQIAQIFNINMVDLIANQDKTFFFSIGDNNVNGHNLNSMDKFQLLLDTKDELLKQKDKEIEALKEIIALLKANVEK
ncbi:anaerobic benzoate catabolism transcriptional regulator [Kingella kingae]|uniref:helix-turn-helix domain-containing protein n=1 Tax=Kingella kingae TaxID=504 RepID=UPI000DF9B505|nr:helix-turn-helix transcriptional regulator [Kingella kingae]QIP48137.1 helix-turn-helix transcriptional regulator [Kingella kingae]STR01994.1 anaerobic benzoate catabolism transcriptional regulator [Kingella kingae]